MPRSVGRLLLHALPIAVLIPAVLWTAIDGGSEAASQPFAEHTPLETPGDGYVTSRKCKVCHPAEFASWYRSYHRTMTQPANGSTVHADFGDVSLEVSGQRYHLHREDDVFWVVREVDDHEKQGGRREIASPIVLVTGSHHMQVYWFPTGNGRELAQLPFTYLRDDDRWIPRRDAFVMPPNDLVSNEVGRWNESCLNCHATRGQPRPTHEAGPDTRVVEYGIACEACHGPAGDHVSENSSPLHRYMQYLGDHVDPKLVQPRDLSPELAAEVCSECHANWELADGAAQARWRRNGQEYRPGGKHEPARWLLQPSRAGSDPRVARTIRFEPDYMSARFWPDGMVRVSGREYNGMIESPCATNGPMTCLSCHRMHKAPDDPRSLDQWADDQLDQGMRGDAGCVQCHEEQQANIQAHTHHAPQSPGSECYNCHMPHTAYALLKASRSHEVTSPDVRTTLETGRPNACNLCHLDRSLGWVADGLTEWYGIPAPALNDNGRSMPAVAVWSLTGDAGLRALAAWHLGWKPAREASAGWTDIMLGYLMDDDYAAVRYIAARSFGDRGEALLPEYDSVPAPASRLPVAPRVLENWTTRRDMGGTLPTVLFDGGRLRMDVVERMLAARDNRAVTLLE